MLYKESQLELKHLLQYFFGIQITCGDLCFALWSCCPNVCLTLASGSRFRGSSMNYKWQNNKKAFVLSVWRSKVGGKSKMCSRYWQNAVRCTTALMLCGLKKANNSLLLYYYILLQVLQQGHSRISNELRITALRLVNQVFFSRTWKSL